MSRGFTLIELVLTIIVLSILSAFTFSVVWQYSKVYSDTRQGYIYGEAAAVMERMTRELRDARAVDTLSPSNPAFYISFQFAHGTPTYNAPQAWVQYCTCSGGGRTQLYRIVSNSKPGTNSCQGGCPTVSTTVSLMSKNIMNGGFQVRGFWGNNTQNNPGPGSDSYEITLRAADAGSAGNPSVALVSRVTPRNYAPYDPTAIPPTGMGLDRSFKGCYYDEIQ